MINNTLRPHALVVHNNGGKHTKKCVCFKNLLVNLDEIDEAYNKAVAKKTPFKVPLILEFTEMDVETFDYQPASNMGNSGAYSFRQPAGKYIYQNIDPSKITYADMRRELDNASKLSRDEVLERIASIGSEGKINICNGDWKTNVSKALVFPITLKNIHNLIIDVISLMAVEKCIGQYSGTKVPESILRACLTLWIVKKAMKKGKKNKYYLDDLLITIDTKVQQDKKKNNEFDNRPVVIMMDDGTIIGSTTSMSSSSNKAVKALYDIANNTVDIILDGKKISASKSGVSPTNAYREDNTSVMPPDLRSGFADDIRPLIPAFNQICQDMAETLVQFTDLRYYIYIDENHPGLPHILKYCEKYRMHRKEINALYKDLNKAKTIEVKKEIKEAIDKKWSAFLSQQMIGSMMFAIEDNVGCSKHKVFAWTNVYTGLTAAKVFLLARFLDAGSGFKGLHNLLKDTYYEFDSHTRSSEEKAKIIFAYLDGTPLSWQDCWKKWRRYIKRSDTQEKASLYWINTMSFIMKLSYAESYKLCENKSIGDLLKEFNKEVEEMRKNREEAILAYLKDLHAFVNLKEVIVEDDEDEDEGSDIKAEVENKPPEKKKWTFEEFLKNMAFKLSAFADVDSDEGKAVVEGYAAGQGFQRVAKQLKGRKSFSSAVGGLTLCDMQIDSMRHLFMELYEKARRKNNALNLPSSADIITSWSLPPKVDSDLVDYFRDAVAIGFNDN